MVDNVSKQNFSGQQFPKYDNIVYQDTFDDQSNVYLPKSILSPPTVSGIVKRKLLSISLFFYDYYWSYILLFGDDWWEKNLMC